MLSGIPLSGAWFRCVSLRRDPLSGEGARLLGGRLNPVGEPAVYLAGTPTLAVAENLQLGSLFGVARFPPRLLVTVDVTLANVVDLRSTSTRSLLQVTADELVADWREASGVIPLQRIGSQLVAQGFEGAVYDSIVEPGATNLVVFVRNVNLGTVAHVVKAT